MKPLRSLTVLIVFIFLSSSMLAQNRSKLTPAQQERAKVQVEIFSPDENDRMFFWYEKQMDSMNLHEDARNEYYNAIYYHIYKMKRLDDKDSKKSNNQKKAAYEKQLSAMHYDVSQLLNPDQYKIHVDSWKQLTASIYRKNNWPVPNN